MTTGPEDFESLLHANTPPKVTSSSEPDLGKAWTPGLRTDGEIVTLVTGMARYDGREQDYDWLASPEGPFWKELREEWMVDPSKMEIIDGSIDLLTWNGQPKNWKPGDPLVKLKRMKCKLKRRSAAELDARVDVDELIAEIKKSKKRKFPKPIDIVDAQNARRAMVVLMSDWQIGKGEGDGTPGTVKRVLTGLEQLVQHIKDLQKLKRAPEVILLVGMGDLVERCSGNYPSQAFISDLDQRQQERVARRLIIHYVNMISDLGIYVMLSGVGGNHGENRNGDGKAYTRPSDNIDVALIDQVGDVIRGNPERYKGRVEVFVPEDGLQLLVELAGVRLGFIHGHQNKSPGASAAAVLEKWWTGQIMGGVDYNLIANAQILNAGHFHHFVQTEAPGRAIFQAPSQDPGSQWYKDSTGRHSPPGMLTYMVGEIYGERLWGDMFMCTSQITEDIPVDPTEILEDPED